MSRNVARGTMLGIGGQGWQLLTALLLQAYVARVFGPALFGNWTVVLSVLAWFEIFVQAGVVKVTTKALSEEPRRSTELSVAGYVGQFVLVVIAFAAIELGAPLIAGLLGSQSFTPLLRISALDIPMFGLLLIASAVVLGLHRFERQGVAWIVYASAKAGLIALFVATGFSITGALVGNAVASLVGFSAMFVPVRGERPSREQAWRVARWMLLASVPFLALALTEGLGQSVDLWIVSAMVPQRTLVGFYSVATVFAEIPVFLFLGLNRVIFPSVASARAEGDPARAAFYTRNAVRLAIIVTVMGVAFISATGRQVIAIVYSLKYVPAYVPVVLLMAAGMGRAIRATCTEVLMAENRRRQALTLLGVTVALEAVLVVALTPRFGLAGAAGGTAASALLAALWGAVLLRSSLGARPLATLGRAAVAAGIVAVALWFVMPPATTPTLTLLAVTLALLAAGAAGYVAGLWLLGEFSKDDIASVRSALGRQG